MGNYKHILKVKRPLWYSKSVLILPERLKMIQLPTIKLKIILLFKWLQITNSIKMKPK
jgi:hypothetical protein